MQKINSICVCGAGTMGSGIAQISAQSGYKTIQFDLNKEMLDKSKINIEKSLQSLLDKQRINEEKKQETLNNLVFTSNLNDCKADLIIEAIVENKEIKVKLFNDLANINSQNTILASNTSSISIKDLAQEIVGKDRVIGMHFFNPATIMKLVEIISIPENTESTIKQIEEVCKRMNKTTVLCKDSPGFIVNRIARHYYLEAMKLIELKESNIEAIDEAMENAGFKMGPFRLMDLIGLDINFSVSNIVYNDLGQPERLKPSIIQQKKVEIGELGKKTNKGFYNY